MEVRWRGSTQNAFDAPSHGRGSVATPEPDKSSSAADKSSSIQVVAPPLQATAPSARKRAIIVIDQRVLIRDCLTRCLNAANDNQIAIAFSSVPEWLEAAATCPPPNIVVLCVPNVSRTDAQIERDLRLLASMGDGTPAVVLTDSDGPDLVIAALNSGARGYVPTSVTLDVAVEAMRLVEAGGTFVPASSRVAGSGAGEASSRQKQRLAELFTKRQAAVVQALQHGKANKQIACELNMREGTVKVHLRNIMRKLKAKNRTEVAVRVSGLLSPPGRT
jgi:DNA-binding NarL/FixJ family response regulator